MKRADAEKVAGRWRQFHYRLRLTHEDLGILLSEKRLRVSAERAQDIEVDPPTAKCCWQDYCARLRRRGIPVNPDWLLTGEGGWLLTGDGKRFFEPVTAKKAADLVDQYAAELMSEDNAALRRARKALHSVAVDLREVAPEIGRYLHQLADSDMLANAAEPVEDVEAGNVVWPATWHGEARA